MSIQITEHDEFLLSQLLDDQLTNAEAETLRARMRREPALQAAYEEFVALDHVMKQRAGDQPAYSSEAFCESVAGRIEQEQAWPAVIRFPLARLMAFGLPMAAAAAIALVVFLPMGTDQSSPAMPGAPTDTEPDVKKAMVQIHKPAEVGDSGASSVRVSFLRSEEIEAEIQQEHQPTQSRWISLKTEPEEDPDAVLPFLMDPM